MQTELLQLAVVLVVEVHGSGVVPVGNVQGVEVSAQALLPEYEGYPQKQG